MHLARRTARDGEVLAREVDEAAIDGGASGHDAIGGKILVGHPEQRRAMTREQRQLLEAALIDETLDPFARGELARLMLLFSALLAAAKFDPRALFAQVGNHRIDGFVVRIGDLIRHRNS